jgi:hypothetical protein
MKKGTRGEAQIDVAAPPSQVYEIVSDVTRMGEWSPETIRCEWLGGAHGPAVGARFKGTNKHGIARWSTKPRVTAADPGHEFAFVIDFRGREATKWSYRFEPVEGGTRVTESFEVMSDQPWFFTAADRYLMRVTDRQADLVQAMQQTLARIKAVTEATPA